MSRKSGDAYILGELTRKVVDDHQSLLTAFRELLEYARDRQKQPYDFGGVIAERAMKRAVAAITKLDSQFAVVMQVKFVSPVVFGPKDAYLSLSDGVFKWTGRSFTSAHAAAWRSAFALFSDCRKVWHKEEKRYCFTETFIKHALQTYGFSAEDYSRICAMIAVEEHRAFERGLTLNRVKNPKHGDAAWTFASDSGAGGALAEPEKAKTELEEIGVMPPGPAANAAWADWFRRNVKAAECPNPIDALSRLPPADTSTVQDRDEALVIVRKIYGYSPSLPKPPAPSENVPLDMWKIRKWLEDAGRHIAPKPPIDPLLTSLVDKPAPKMVGTTPNRRRPGVFLAHVEVDGANEHTLCFLHTEDMSLAERVCRDMNDRQMLYGDLGTNCSIKIVEAWRFSQEEADKVKMVLDVTGAGKPYDFHRQGRAELHKAALESIRRLTEVETMPPKGAPASPPAGTVIVIDPAKLADDIAKKTIEGIQANTKLTGPAAKGGRGKGMAQDKGTGKAKRAGKGKGGGAGSLATLEKITPKFNATSGAWVKNKLAAKLENVGTPTLKKYRSQGVRNKAGTLGRDGYGRVWRRPGTPGSHPWYLKSTLISEKSSGQNRG